MEYSYQFLEIERHGPIATVFMNRPDEHNCFDPKLIEELTCSFGVLGSDKDVRVVVLAGRGRSFSAGADLNWMKSMSEMTFEENVVDAKRMANMFRTIFCCPKPTIAKVHGAALGGGMGLVAVCDIAVASSRARFGFTEVRLGIAPAVIAPFVIYKTHPSVAHRYFLTGERFDATLALQMGLVASVHEEDELDKAVSEIAYELSQGAPEAQANIKCLIARSASFDPDSYIEYTSDLIATMRISEEGQEGMSCFFKKIQPSWLKGGATDG